MKDMKSFDGVKKMVDELPLYPLLYPTALEFPLKIDRLIASDLFPYPEKLQDYRFQDWIRTYSPLC
jgi:hypothetical protein